MKYQSETQFHERRDYLHTVHAGAWLPAIQSLIGGVIVFAVVLVIGLMLRSRNPLGTAGIWGLSVTALMWMVLQRHWFRLTDIERMTGLDLNRDGTIGKPEPKAAPVRHVRVQMDHLTEQGHVDVSQVFELPATEDQLIALADGLLNYGSRFSVREWCGAGKPFSVSEFNALRLVMSQHGLIEQASEKDARAGGYLLTPEGKSVLRDFLSV